MENVQRKFSRVATCSKGVWDQNVSKEWKACICWEKSRNRSAESSEVLIYTRVRLLVAILQFRNLKANLESDKNLNPLYPYIKPNNIVDITNDNIQ